MAFNYSPKIITDGLVLYLDAANPKSYVSGSTTWGDLSRGGNNGTLVNGPTFNAGNGGSIVFDGVNDQVNIQNSNIYKPQFPVSLTCWFIVQNLSNYGILIRTDNTNSTHIGITLNVASDYTLGVSYGNNTANTSTGRRSYGGLTPIEQNKWYNFVTILPDNVNCLGYLNGNLYDLPFVSGTANTLVYSNVGASIGWRLDTPGNSFFKGNISQVSIYNRALSAQEILQNYNATKTRFGL
jgi:hypothetical protein